MTAPLLVFDLDGTLVDSAPDLLATLDVVLARHGFVANRDPGLRDGIGHGARHLIEFALHRQDVTVPPQQLDAMHHDFLDYYEANICEETRLFPGLEALLDRFEAAGWRFAVCTNKVEDLSRLVLEELGVLSRFATVAGGDTFGTRKPDPGHLLGAIAAAGGAPDAAIMVGDSHIDRDTARSAGVPFVGVSFGYTPVSMAELGPDLLIDGYDELDLDVALALLVPRSAGPERALAVGALGAAVP
jgi:phosphoglycolate phosphatase